jgi:hypothetical protein
MRKLRGAVLLLAAGVADGLAQDQYPSPTVRFIVPSSLGAQEIVRVPIAIRSDVFRRLGRSKTL